LGSSVTAAASHIAVKHLRQASMVLRAKACLPALSRRQTALPSFLRMIPLCRPVSIRSCIALKLNTHCS
jgi:hypothetical protein